jgi:VanZ family protein
MKKILFFVPAALYYAFIFYLSSRSHDIKIDILFFDKVIHIVEFVLLGILLSFGYFMSLKSPLMVRVVLTICSGILLGGLDEFHQSFIPSRSFEFFDIIADAIGILIGLLLYYYFSRSAKGKIFAEKLSKS